MGNEANYEIFNNTDYLLVYYNMDYLEHRISVYGYLYVW
jgi:hypothetical protein